jgi:catechol 2,3-dioxygenase-like lactoylglutathione lyase family enzyme
MAETGWELESLYHTVIDASDLDRSVAFYRKLGFAVLHDRRDAVWPDFVARNFGLRRAQGRGVLLVLPGDPDGPMLDVIQWLEPPLAKPDPQTADRRVPRILAFRTRNIERAYAELRAAGIEFTGELCGPFPELGVRGVVCCKDPDGAIVELMELEPGVRHSQAQKLPPRPANA